MLKRKDVVNTASQFSQRPNSCPTCETTALFLTLGLYFHVLSSLYCGNDFLLLYNLANFFFFLIFEKQAPQFASLTIKKSSMFHH